MSEIVELPVAQRAPQASAGLQDAAVRALQQGHVLLCLVSTSSAPAPTTSSPTQARRILRVLINVNPNGQGRHWRLGEPFEAAAKRFPPRLPAQLPGSAALLHKLGTTKSRRSAYHHTMLELPDGMKADPRYQGDVAQIAHTFTPRCCWMVYTDQASHAAMGGQFALEQTWTIDVAAMNDPSMSPLQVLQRLTGRELV